MRSDRKVVIPRRSASRGSHLPVLIALVQKTTGPILELGVGYCSSPYLHWVCHHTKRRIVSYESNPRYYDYAKTWARNDYHEIHCIESWDETDFSEPWAIAFIDNSPSDSRVKNIAKLVHADYLVLHDSEGSADAQYHYSDVEHLFQYRFKYKLARPFTSIWSNKLDVDKIISNRR